MSFDLTGKIALVTGSSTGLGKQIALALGRAGAKVAINYAKVPKKRPRFCARGIRQRDGNRCQYTGQLLKPDEGSVDHILPRSRGGPNTWENCVWAAKHVNTRKGNRLPDEAGLKLLKVPRAPKELPVTFLISNAFEIKDWNRFLG